MNIRRQAIRMICLIVILLLVCTGCSAGETPEPQQAMGRYVEEVVALPDNLEQIYYLDLRPSDEMVLVGWSSNSEFSMWTASAKSGGWITSTAPWLQSLAELKIAWINCLSLDVSGIPYCLYTPETPDTIKIAEQGGFQDDIELPDPVLARYVNGEWQDTGILLAYKGTFADTFKVLEDGGIMASYYTELVTYSPSGSILAEFHSEDRMLDGFFQQADGVLSFSNKNKLERYDMETGQALQELELQRGDAEQDVEYATGRPPQTAISRDTKSGGICYANKSGIYQTTDDGQLTEKMVDGSLTSLVMPSVEILQLFAAENGSFLVYASDNHDTPMLLRYRYDKAVSTVPGTKLRVYSLYDTPTIRQAMGSFQRSHPNVVVSYEVGRTETDGVTYEDALRTVSTELLANNGPDLLVLDGLPMNSYIEKGVLMDLGGFEDDLLENIVGAFQQDGKTFAVPAHFRLPILLAEPDVATKVQTPSALADYLATQQNPRIKMEPEYLFQELYRYYWYRWYNEDGTLDTAVLSEDLEAFGRIRKQLEQLNNPAGGEMGGDMITNGLLWKDGSINLYIGSLFALNNMRGPYTALREKEGAITLYPGEIKAFEPTVVLGINAASRQPELARELIDHLLSKEQQSFELGDGLPVNRSAFRAILGAVPPNEQSDVWGMNGVDPETGEEKFFVTQSYWPDEACQAQILELAESVKKPYYGNYALAAIFIQEADNYFTGQRSLDDTVHALEQKANLLLSEQ